MKPQYQSVFYRNSKTVRRLFATLDDARAYASRVFERQGVVISIEPYTHKTP